MKVVSRKALTVPGALLLGAGIAVNLLAYRHARAFTTFEESGSRTPQPEHLTMGQKLTTLLEGPTLPKPRNEQSPADVGLRYGTLRFANGDGDTLEAWHVPGGRGLVVMFHGYADSKDSLLDPAKAFSDLGWSLLMVDFRGSGGSSGHETSIGYHEARDVAAAAAVARGLRDEPLLLYGVSMGAAAILRAAAVEDVTAEALVLEMPFDRMLGTVENRFETLGAPAFPGAQLLLLWGGRQQRFDPFVHNPVDYAASVEIPTLLMQGERDRRVTLEEARSIYSALRGPKILETFPKLAHQSLVKGDPGRWNSAVERIATLIR